VCFFRSLKIFKWSFLSRQKNQNVNFCPYWVSSSWFCIMPKQAELLRPGPNGQRAEIFKFYSRADKIWKLFRRCDFLVFTRNSGYFWSSFYIAILGQPLSGVVGKHFSWFGQFIGSSNLDASPSLSPIFMSNFRPLSTSVEYDAQCQQFSF